MTQELNDTRLLEAEGVGKEYRLGMIGGGALHEELAMWWAEKRGLENPNSKVGSAGLYRREKFKALDDINLSLDRGDAVGLVGRNGAGKSTLLKLISRITLPTEGEIRIRGRVASLLEVGTGFHRELTGRENIYLNGAVLGMPRRETEKKIDRIIEFSEIGQFIDTPVKRYSSGMYVKLAFAVAAHLDPDILICDEVLAVGDIAFQQKCLSKMSDVARSGCAVMYVSHNMRTVAELCNRGLFLDRGHLTYDGTTERAIELYAGSGNRERERDLSQLPRARARGVQLRMLSMRVLGEKVSEFEQDDVMEFEVTFRSGVSDAKMRLRTVVKSGMSMPIGECHSEPFEIKRDETYTVRVKFPLTGLCPGEYGMKLSLFSVRADGQSGVLDTIEDVGHFIIREDITRNDGFAWLERWYGSFRMEPLRLIDVRTGEAPAGNEE